MRNKIRKHTAISVHNILCFGRLKRLNWKRIEFFGCTHHINLLYIFDVFSWFHARSVESVKCISRSNSPDVIVSVASRLFERNHLIFVRFQFEMVEFWKFNVHLDKLIFCCLFFHWFFSSFHFIKLNATGERLFWERLLFCVWSLNWSNFRVEINFAFSTQ